ncbi:MAG: rRNA maturation RNase YbeY [Pararhodobacter sp.]|nr:rRNA maturation RNase YbeY [Pararhodobacter sp.]
MPVEVNFEDPRWQGHELALEPLAERAARATLAHLGLDLDGYEISLLACNDARIRALNAQFRGKDKATNVLSWPASDLAAGAEGAAPASPPPGSADEPEALGDIALAFETCMREAGDQGKAAGDHAAHLLVHSVLHLLGYDHEREGDARLMEQTETAILAKLGIADPYSQGGGAPDMEDDVARSGIWKGTMNDTHSGSGAAHGAQGEDEPSSESNGQRGFLGRLMGALAPGEDDPEHEGEQGIRRVLPGLANLRRLRVEDVAVPKAEIVAVAQDIGRDELIAVFRESGFSRIPVYAETLDRPVGLLLLKDLVLTHGFGQGEGPIELTPLLRPLLFVPPSMPLAVLLQKMQAERTHMALVIDEYGGVDGLVTIEDLLEQVVGEIDDEHDTADEGLWQLEAPGIWQIEARAQLEDIEAALGFGLGEGVDDEDVDTLGGLVFVLLGRVPVRGEVILHPAGYEIEVLDADPRRVRRLRLRLPDAVTGADTPPPAGAAGKAAAG